MYFCCFFPFSNLNQLLFYRKATHLLRHFQMFFPLYLGQPVMTITASGRSLKYVFFYLPWKGLVFINFLKDNQLLKVVKFKEKWTAKSSQKSITWLVDMKFLFSHRTRYLTHELSCWELEENFYIYMHPCISLSLMPM